MPKNVRTLKSYEYRYDSDTNKFIHLIYTFILRLPVIIGTNMVEYVGRGVAIWWDKEVIS